MYKIYKWHPCQLFLFDTFKDASTSSKKQRYEEKTQKIGMETQSYSILIATVF